MDSYEIGQQPEKATRIPQTLTRAASTPPETRDPIASVFAFAGNYECRLVASTKYNPLSSGVWIPETFLKICRWIKNQYATHSPRFA